VSAAPPQGHALHVVYGGTFDPVHLGHLSIAEGARQALLGAGLAVQRFDWLPNADPPHRSAPGANAGHRVAMLWLALSGHPEFGIDLREMRRGGASYMADTLAELRAEIGPQAPLLLMMGADAWAGFERWQRWREIPALAHLLVVDRPDAPGAMPSAALDALARQQRLPLAGLSSKPAGGIVGLSLPPHPASASAVRAALAEAEAHRSQPDRSQASRAEPSRFEPNSVEPSRVESRQSAPGQSEPSRAEALLAPAVAAYIRRNGLYRPESPSAESAVVGA